LSLAPLATGLPIVAAQLEKGPGEVEKKAERADKAAKEGSRRHQ
jgi:hypothetical protein